MYTTIVCVYYYHVYVYYYHVYYYTTVIYYYVLSPILLASVYTTLHNVPYYYHVCTTDIDECSAVYYYI